MTRNKIKLALAATLLIAPMALTEVASADGKHGGKTSTTTTSAVGWTLESANCSTLPPGTTITGSGELTSKKTERTKRGVTSLKFADHAEGTATDQNGNTYRWTYDNELSMENAPDWPLLFHGEMTDVFRLTGGPIQLSNGFEAVTVEDQGAGTFAIYPESSYGDPFNFPTGPNRCDPL